MDKGIADWRKEIDNIDKKLLEMFNERAKCAIEIGKLKRARKLELYDPERESEILSRMIVNNSGPMDNKAVTGLSRRIIDESRRIERLAAAARNRGDAPNVEESEE